MRIIFVSNNWDDAHQQTRLTGIGTMNIEVIPMGFKRKYYEGTSKIKPLWIGSMVHGSYFRRIGTCFAYSLQLLKIAKKQDWVYVFGFDVFIITSLIRLLVGYKIVYEIPDIRESFFRGGLLGFWLRFLEKLFIPRAALIVPTSKAYVTEYFHKLRNIRPTNFLTIENKIHDAALKRSAVEPEFSSIPKLRIGYFGLLRCPMSLQCLILLAALDKYDIVLRGIFMPQTESYKEIIKNTKGIIYEGPYNEHDLSHMYEHIDICWAAYPFSPKTIGNHLFARTNRYYESMFYQRPMIVQNNSADYLHATELGLKVITLDLENPARCVDIIEKNLSKDFLTQARAKQITIAKSDYIINDEYIRLLTCLQQKQ